MRSHHILTSGHAFVQISNKLAKGQDVLEERNEELSDALQCDNQEGVALKVP